MPSRYEKQVAADEEAYSMSDLVKVTRGTRPTQSNIIEAKNFCVVSFLWCKLKTYNKGLPVNCSWPLTTLLLIKQTKSNTEIIIY